MKTEEIAESIRFVMQNGQALLDEYQFPLKEVIVFKQDHANLDDLAKEMRQIAFNSLALSEDQKVSRQITLWGVMAEDSSGERFVVATTGVGEESERFAKFIATALYNFMPLVQLFISIQREAKE